MSYSKNQEISVEITALGNDGEGIGHLPDGMTIFIPGTVPGDKVMVTKFENAQLFVRKA